MFLRATLPDNTETTMEIESITLGLFINEDDRVDVEVKYVDEDGQLEHQVIVDDEIVWSYVTGVQ